MHIQRLISILAIMMIASFACAQETIVPAGDKLLVWTGDGQSPAQVMPGNPGQLVFMDGGDASETVLNLPAGTTRVEACGGDQSTSPDGRYFLFFTGTDIGTIHLMDRTEAPRIVADSQFAMSCTGQGTLQFSPDSSRFAYLSYSANVNTQPYPAGKLLVIDPATLNLLDSFESVIAFDLEAELMAHVSFYPNNQGEAVEAAFTVYDGNSDREVATLLAEDGCQYTSASIAIKDESTLVAIIGHRCRTGSGRTNWQLYTINTANRSAILAVGAEQIGQFASQARTNNVYIAPQSSHVFFTVPDGITTNTTGMNRVDLNSANLLPLPVANRDLMMARFASNSPYLIENHPPVLSPDGSWIALAQNTADNDASIKIVDFANPDLPPIERSAGERGYIVSEILFTPDSTKAIYVIGGHSSNNNSLWMLDLETDTDFRIRRGRYDRGVLSPDGSKMAIMNWEVIGQRQLPFLNLAVIDLEDSAETVIFVGAIVNEGRVTNHRFAYPLSWRSTSK